MTSKSNLRLLPQEESKARIVQILKETLEQAESGNVQGIVLLTEDSRGKFCSERDGMSDSYIIFALELMKRRILGKYE